MRVKMVRIWQLAIFWRWLASRVPFESWFSIAGTFSWCYDVDFQGDWSSR